MTKVYGFLCDHCGAKSQSQKTFETTWYEVMTMRVSNGGEWRNMGAFPPSDGVHYCSKKCLVEASANF